MDLVKFHIQVVEEYSKQIADEKSSTQKEAALLRDQARSSFEIAQAAWEEYADHVKKHGC